jgi:hypothetical protein
MRLRTLTLLLLPRLLLPKVLSLSIVHAISLPFLVPPAWEIFAAFAVMPALELLIATDRLILLCNLLLSKTLSLRRLIEYRKPILAHQLSPPNKIVSRQSKPSQPPSKTCHLAKTGSAKK